VTVTNALVKYGKELITLIKIFIVQDPGADVIKTFFQCNYTAIGVTSVKIIRNLLLGD
jgi:hypothetical protein